MRVFPSLSEDFDHREEDLEIDSGDESSDEDKSKKSVEEESEENDIGQDLVEDKVLTTPDAYPRANEEHVPPTS